MNGGRSGPACHPGNRVGLNGLIHLLGFVGYSQLAQAKPSSQHRLLSGKLEVGEAGANVFAMVWLLAAVGFVVGGVAVYAQLPWWSELTFSVALLPLVLTVLGWRESWFGVVANVVILTYLLVGRGMDWLL